MTDLAQPPPDPHRHAAVCAASRAALLIAASPASAASLRAPRDLVACTTRAGLVDWGDAEFDFDQLRATDPTMNDTMLRGDGCRIIWKSAWITTAPAKDRDLITVKVLDGNGTAYLAYRAYVTAGAATFGAPIMVTVPFRACAAYEDLMEIVWTPKMNPPPVDCKTAAYGSVIQAKPDVLHPEPFAAVVIRSGSSQTPSSPEVSNDDFFAVATAVNEQGPQ
jgi:hypothetical protein